MATGRGATVRGEAWRCPEGQLPTAEAEHTGWGLRAIEAACLRGPRNPGPEAGQAIWGQWALEGRLSMTLPCVNAIKVSS